MKQVTMKFGGTSVGSPESISNVTDIVRGHLEAGTRVVVVVSAMSGVTDQLIDAARKAMAGNKWGYLSTAEGLRERHEAVLTRLVQDEEERKETLRAVNLLVDEFVNVCNAINILGELTPRIMDSIVSFGERLSSRGDCCCHARQRHHGPAT